MAQFAGGSPSATTSSSSSASRWTRTWVWPVLLGVVGAVGAHWLRTPVQLPGHNGFILMLALLGGRLTSGNRLGGVTAGGAGLAASLAFGHDVTGAMGLAPAGAAIDAVLAFPAPGVSRVVQSVAAGAAGNLAVLLVKLSADDLPKAAVTHGIAYVVLTYSVFGAVAGLAISLAGRPHARQRS